MPKPSLRKKESAAATAGTPMIIGIASGARPRLISIATYQDAEKTFSFRSNHFGKRQEIASPVDGTPLTIVDAPQDVATAELHPTLTQVGNCDYCATDLYATKATASEIAGRMGHCIMCAQSVTFTAEAASDAPSAETVSEDVTDFSDAPTEVAGDNTNQFDFNEIELVNIDDMENEEASMARKDDQKAIVDALRARVTASDDAHDMGDDEEDENESPEEESEETEEDEAEEEGEEPMTNPSEEMEETEEPTEEDEEDDEFAEDEEASASTAPQDPPTLQVETPVTVDTPVEPTVVAEAEAPPPAAETVVASDVAIDNYQAVEIETVDLSDALLVPVTESAAYVMLGAQPALYLNKEAAAETVQAVWAKPDTLRHALTAAFKTSTDRHKTLASFGGEVVNVPTSMRGYAKQTLDAYAQRAEAEVAATTQNHSVRFERALSTAALGVVKRSFGPTVVDTVTAGLVATLENHGVRNAQSIVLASLRDTMPVFLKTVLEQANTLAQESDDVLSTTAEMVGNAAYPVELPEPTPIVAQPTTVSEVASTAPNKSPVVIETASPAVVPRALDAANIARVVASLGGR